MSSYARSAALYERACQSLAGGVSSHFRKFSQPHPLFYAQGQGSRIVDIDANEYLDFTLSQGPLILGHSHPEVLSRVAEASQDGQLYAGQYLAELELAEKLQSFIPCAERLRFSLSGSESVHTALRLARAATGRPRFLRFEGHYHGWLDNVAVGISAPSPDDLGDREAPQKPRWSAGLPDHVEDECFLLPWNDLALVEKTLAEHHTEIAAIITEPIMCNNGCILPQPGFLAGLRALCDRYAILLIFDEVITGFRLGLGGAQAQFDVTPDLAIFGKAMASGYPISALVGKQKFMSLIAEGRVIHAGTMNSGVPSVAAALATISVLEQPDFYDRLYRFGNRLKDGLAEAAQRSGQSALFQGPGPMFHMGFTARTHVREYRDTFTYDTAKYAQFVFAMQERGIRLIGRGLWYVSGAHTDADIDHCLDTATALFQSMKG